MLQISRSSWHYRLLLWYYGKSFFYDHMDVQKHVGLCNYFWGTVLALATGWLVAIGRGILTLEINWSHPTWKIDPIIMMFIGWGIIGGVGVYYTATNNYLSAVAEFGFLGLLIFLRIIAIGKLDGFLKKLPELKRKPKPKKQPNIAWEYAKAWKKRHCPLLDFTD